MDRYFTPHLTSDCDIEVVANFLVVLRERMAAWFSKGVAVTAGTLTVLSPEGVSIVETF